MIGFPATSGRDNSEHTTYCRVFKVVEAVVGQDEPPSLPRLHPATCGEEKQKIRKLFARVKANLQKTPAPRATSGSDQPCSALLASITGCKLPLATPPGLKRLTPAGLVEGGGIGGRWVVGVKTVSRHVHTVYK